MYCISHSVSIIMMLPLNWIYEMRKWLTGIANEHSYFATDWIALLGRCKIAGNYQHQQSLRVT